MKKTISSLLALLTVSAVGFASPLNDFSSGKVAIDVSVRPHPDFTAKEGEHANRKIFDGRDFMEYGITLGLGNNFAFQYCQANPKANLTHYYNRNLHAKDKLETQDFNILYKISNNYSVFTGIKQIKEIVSGDGYEFGSDTKTNWQLGITGQGELGKNLNGWATIAAGKDISSWKIGISYAIDKNLDLNIFYAENKYNKVVHNNTLSVENHDDKADYTNKGIGYGITYKF